MNVGRCLPHIWGFGWGDVERSVPVHRTMRNGTVSSESASHLTDFVQTSGGTHCFVNHSHVILSEWRLSATTKNPSGLALKGASPPAPPPREAGQLSQI